MDFIKQEQLRRDFVPDFSDGKKQKLSRPLKADGAAGTIALALLRGDKISIQNAIALLAAHGIVSNDTGRRMREALAWLLKRGVTVHKQLRTSTEKSNFHVWYIPRTSTYTQQLANMIKGK